MGSMAFWIGASLGALVMFVVMGTLFIAGEEKGE